LRKPKLLVLDECTANLDFQTEQKVVDVLLKMKEHICVFAISHKNTFDALADETLQLS
jgi:ABC-type bacteriocin/lantibiotic exporter with double-glycine peptidase domain